MNYFKELNGLLMGDDFINSLVSVITAKGWGDIYVTHKYSSQSWGSKENATGEELESKHFFIFLSKKFPEELSQLVQVFLEKNFYKELSERDDVTKLLNQRRLFKDLDLHIARSKKNKSIFNVLFIDMDKFKNVNDLFGHVIGSRFLTKVGDIIKDTIKTKYLYRYGGDEFVAIVENTSSDKCIDDANQLLANVRNHDFIVEGHDVYKLSISIGISEFPTDTNNREEIIQLADQMMYTSKKLGRGQVVHVKKMKEESKNEEVS